MRMIMTCDSGDKRGKITQAQTLGGLYNSQFYIRRSHLVTNFQTEILVQQGIFLRTICWHFVQFQGRNVHAVDRNGLNTQPEILLIWGVSSML